MNETDKQTEIISLQQEGIKLVKNSKGYNWEIKILTLDIEQLEKLNNKMIERFGSYEE